MESYQEKLQRAYAHLEAFNNSINVWHNSQPYEILPHRETHDGVGYTAAWYIRQVKEFDPVWSLIVGDALFDMRSALDHLAFALAQAHCLAQQISIRERDVSFPIYTSDTDFKKSGVTAISQMDPAVQAKIETLQPYNRPDRAYLVALGTLKALNDVDKHRRFVLEGEAESSGGIHIGSAGPAAMRTGYRVAAFKATLSGVGSETKIMEFGWPMAVPRPEMNVEAKLTFHPTLAKTSRVVPGARVMDVLVDIFQSINAEVLPVLGSALSKGRSSFAPAVVSTVIPIK